VPSQLSTGSQVSSVDVRQDTPLASTASGGQLALPVQNSASSQVPVAARHSTPSRKISSQSADVPVQ